MSDDNIDEALLLAAQLEWPRNLRAAVIHEFAHKHVAEHFGIFGWVQIRPNPTGDGLTEKFFAGSFNMEHTDDAHATRVVALAGVCAEILDMEPATDAAHVMRLIEDEAIEFSATDAAGAGEFSADDITESLGIVRARWSSITKEANGTIDLETRLAATEGRLPQTNARLAAHSISTSGTHTKDGKD